MRGKADPHEEGAVWDSVPDGPATAAASAAISAGAAAHAWVLLGPRGAGKMQVALAMAAALTCRELPGLGCGRCGVCLRIARRSYLDIHHIAPEGPIISVEVIRTIVIPEALRSPFEGGRKVFVIEEAERMNPQAQNALLKTLEEPPLDTVFILLCDQEDELLETVRSRCRALRLEAVAEGEVVAWLERRGAPPVEAAWAARLAGGDLDRAAGLGLDPEAGRRWRLFAGMGARLVSPVDALDAAAEVMTEASAASKARARAQKEEVEELAESLGDGRGTATLRSALARRHKRELRRAEEEVLVEALEALGSFYRDVLTERAGAGASVANVDHAGEVEKWAASEVSSRALVEAMHRCADAPNALAKNANPTLTMEATLVALARLVPAAESPLPATAP